LGDELVAILAVSVQSSRFVTNRKGPQRTLRGHEDPAVKNASIATSIEDSAV
jgi:hypothetical protein